MSLSSFLKFILKNQVYKIIESLYIIHYTWVSQGDSLMAQMVKHKPAVQETQVPFLGQEGSLEKEMATHSSTFA